MTFPVQLSDPPATGHPTRVNENFAAIAWAGCYSNKASTTAGLVRGYNGGRWGGFSPADVDHTFGTSTTTYVSVNRSTGALDFSTSSTNYDDLATYATVETVVTDGSGVTSVLDDRGGPGGVHGQIDPSAGAVDADDVAITDSGGYYTSTDVEGALQEIGISLASLGGLVDVLTFEGVIDCSANPNYPAANAGAVYVVSVAGKIGGSSGPNVEAGDTLICRVDATASGNHATVGANWTILQRNIDGAVTGPTASVDGEVALFDSTTGKLLKRATGSGYPKLTSGVQSVQTAAQLRADLGEKVQALTDGSTISVDASLANNFRVTLGGNRTLANPTNLIDGQVLNFRVHQDGTGSRTLAYGSKYKWPAGTAPTLSTAASAKDFISCQYDATDDTLYCVCNKAFA